MLLYPRHTDGLEAMHAKHLDDWLRGRESSIVIIIFPLKALMKDQVCSCVLKKVFQSCKTLQVASGLSGAIGEVILM